jgi:hypothetical protein
MKNQDFKPKFLDKILGEIDGRQYASRPKELRNFELRITKYVNISTKLLNL